MCWLEAKGSKEGADANFSNWVDLIAVVAVL